MLSVGQRGLLDLGAQLLEDADRCLYGLLDAWLQSLDEVLRGNPDTESLQIGL